MLFCQSLLLISPHQQREIRQHQQRIRLKRQEDRYDRFNSKLTHKNDENYETVGSKEFSFEGKYTADNDCNNDNDNEEMEEKNHNREVKDKELKHDVIFDVEISRGEIDKTASDSIDMRKYINICYTTKTLFFKVFVDEEISRGEIDKTASDFIDMRKYRNIRYTTDRKSVV